MAESKEGGFLNKGTCYLGSTLQLLFHVPPFAAWLSSGCFLNNTVTKVLADLSRLQRAQDVVDPEPLVALLHMVSTTLKRNCQEDANEFLGHLLSRVVREFRVAARSHFVTPVHRMFCTAITQFVTCKDCCFTSSTESTFPMQLVLSFPLQSVQEGLQNYVKPVDVIGGCTNCKSKEKKKAKSTCVLRPPLHCLVQLARFTFRNNKPKKCFHSVKIEKSVTFADAQYSLLGAVIHLGRNINSGHYNALCRSSSQGRSTWNLYNDGLVKCIDIDDYLNSKIATENIYILAYERKVAPPERATCTSKKWQCSPDNFSQLFISHTPISQSELPNISEGSLQECNSNTSKRNAKACRKLNLNTPRSAKQKATLAQPHCSSPGNISPLATSLQLVCSSPGNISPLATSLQLVCSSPGVISPVASSSQLVCSSPGVTSPVASSSQLVCSSPVYLPPNTPVAMSSQSLSNPLGCGIPVKDPFCEDDSRAKLSLSQTSRDKVSEEAEKEPSRSIAIQVSPLTASVACQASFPPASYEFCVRGDPDKFHYFTGVTPGQFTALYNLLGGDEKCAKLKYRYDDKTPMKYPNNLKLSLKSRLYLVLIRMRRGLSLVDVSEIMGVSKSLCGLVFFTWVRFLALQCKELQEYLVVSAERQNRDKPACFLPFKNLRMIIDTTGFHIEKSRHLQQQGNTYSDFYGFTCAKCAVMISCYGGVSRVTDCYEGRISDKELVMQSGILDLLQEGDALMADRGFKLEEECLARKVTLLKPPEMRSKTCLTGRQEVQTKSLASVRIYVEHVIGKIKNWKILDQRIELLLQPLLSDMVQIAAFIHNFSKCYIH